MRNDDHKYKHYYAKEYIEEYEKRITELSSRCFEKSKKEVDTYLDL